MARPVDHEWSTTIEHEDDRLVGEPFQTEIQLLGRCQREVGRAP